MRRAALTLGVSEGLLEHLLSRPKSGKLDLDILLHPQP
jgi:hypothetical protein